MFNKRLAIFLALVSMLILAACQPGQTEPLPVTGEEDLPPAVQAVLEQVSQQFGVEVQNIEIVETEQVEWPDACLGLPEVDEACAEVVTPGFRVELTVNDETFEFRTDESGQIIRQAPP
jgi:hypothetical protein